MKIVVEITPVALARPRVNTQNRGRYLPPRSMEFRRQMQRFLLLDVKVSKPSAKPLKVTLHFYKPLKTTAQKYGDVDNLTKAVLDACNGILWLDDKQIVEMHSYKHKGAGKIEMEVEECT